MEFPSFFGIFFTFPDMISFILWNILLIMDRKSMAKARQSCKLRIGLDDFVDMAFADKKVDAQVMCPCGDCGEDNSVTIKVGKDNLNSFGSSAVDYAKIFSNAMTSLISSENQTSCGNGMNVMDENFDLKLFRDFVDRRMQLGVEGKELNDSIAKYYSLQRSAKTSDKSISMLIDLSKEVSEEGKDPSRSSVNQIVTLFNEEEDDETFSGEMRNQPSASTSSGSTGYSQREENRRRLREKINQRKVSRAPRIR